MGPASLGREPPPGHGRPATSSPGRSGPAEPDLRCDTRDPDPVRYLGFRTRKYW
jgi:hypothetical protein